MLSVAVEHRFGAFTLAAAFATPLAGVTALFGPSGSGKSLIVRCIAGLERVPQARIACADECWQDGRRFVAAERRRVGYVPQHAGLFAHLDVRGNLEYGLRRSRGPRPGFDAVVAMLGIEPLLAQPATTLSGGQRQRVAIGRALLAGPRLLLLDEPMAALDQPARRALVSELRALQQETGVSMLYVSHAADEIERLADRVVFVRDGRVDALQSIDEISASPASPLFHDDGPIALFDAEPVGWSDDGLLELRVGALRLQVPASRMPRGPVRLRIAARDVALATLRPAQTSFRNVLELQVDALHPGRPGCVLVRCSADGVPPLLAELTARAVDALGIAPGCAVVALVKAAALID